MTDIRSTTVAAVAFTHAARTGSANGETIDLQGYNSCVVVIQAHAVSTASAGNGFTFKLQDSPDGTNWTDVAASDFTGSASILATGVANTIVGTFGYAPVSKAAQRYVRAVATAAGTTNAAFSAVAILRDGRVK